MRRRESSQMAAKVRIHRIRATGLCVLVFFLGSVVRPARAGAQTSFGPVNVGSSTSGPATITIPNGGTLASIAVVTQGATNLDYSQASGGTCAVGTGYLAGATCTVNVTFTPKFAGGRSGAVVLADGSNNVIGTGYLQGTGVGSQLAFNLGNLAPFKPIPATLLGLPTALAMDDSGDIYVADSGTSGSSQSGRVLKETPSAGGYVQSVVASGFYYPLGIGIDGAGNVYVADAGTNQVNFSNIVYKETLFNGQYQQSPIYIATQALAVDGIGNVYVFALQNTTGAGLYAALLQPDGTYIDTTELPAPDLSNFLLNYTCGIGPPPGGLNIEMSVGVDGSGHLYFVSGIDCINQFNQTKDFVGAFEYSSGITQPPTIVSTGAIQSNIGQIPLLTVDERANLFLFNAAGTNPYISESNSAGYVLPVPSLGTVYPFALATDAAGDVVIVGDVQGVRSLYQIEYANPPALSFQPTSVGVASPDSPQEMTVVQISSQPVTISSISYPADFPEDLSFANGYSATCASGTTLSGVNNFCLVPIDFIPAQSLGNQGSLQLSEDVTLTTTALGSPALIPVIGTEILPYAATPQASIPGGTYTSVQTVTLSDSTAGAAIYFTIDGTAPTTSSTPYTGAITVSQTETIEAIAALAGHTQSPVFSATYTINLPPTFTLGLSVPSLSISAGQSGNLTASVTPQNGFNSTVSFSCSGLPAGASCSFSPTTVTPSGGVASTTLTVSASAAARTSRLNLWPVFFPVFPAAMLLVGLGCRSGRKRSCTILALALLAVVLMPACGGGSSPGLHSATSTVTVSASGGSLQQTTTFTLTVQ
ncbi:MAG TPA: chitobiase/beta-hexosaminidase C-terminal domain-containing protein [Candidatus Dormibacteraeota bacterium]|nr:chitobiase/beta-hexosaminidase C-terminal domain-containing protein [Candidatus Dormibacteraeota bacterium]